MLFSATAWAQTAPQAAPSPFMQFVPLLIVGIIMYFLILRPTLKKNKEHRLMMGELKHGDEVWTSGGIYGIVEQVDAQTVKLKISDSTAIKILKSQISAKVDKNKQTT